MASIVEEIVDLTVSVEPFLCVSNSFELLCFSFSPSDWNV